MPGSPPDSPGPEPATLGQTGDGSPTTSAAPVGLAPDNEPPAVDNAMKRELDSHVQEVLSSDVKLSQNPDLDIPQHQGRMLATTDLLTEARTFRLVSRLC